MGMVLIKFGRLNKMMRNPTHGAMYARFEDGSSEEEKVIGRCFVLIGAEKSPMNLKVRSLFESFDIPFNSYDVVLFDFDDTIYYFKDMLISVSSDAENQNHCC